MLLGTGPLESSPNLKETVTRLRRLVELSTVLNSTLNLNELLLLIIQTASDLLECETASILLYDEKSPHLFFAASTEMDADKLAEISVPLNDSLAGTIFRTNEPIILNRLEGDPRHNLQASEHVGFQAKSLLGVPMRIRTKTIGVLEALNKRGSPFSQADQDIMTVIASHAAVAINNAQLMQALRQSYEQAKQADQLKSDFLAVASHELRTPLGIIIGYSTFLREEAQGEMSNHAEQVLAAAMQMRALVEDMTNLTLLETEKSTYQQEQIAIQDILKIAGEEVLELTSIKAQTLQFDLPVQPLLVKIDPKKTINALVNLLHNAVRFSPDEKIITIGAKREGEQVLCWIQDQGIGIPSDELNKIFERFHQVETPNVRRYGGMGLGLTIARGLIEAQGGKLWAESEGEGKGTIFKVLLPLA